MDHWVNQSFPQKRAVGTDTDCIFWRKKKQNILSIALQIPVDDLDLLFLSGCIIVTSSTTIIPSEMELTDTVYQQQDTIGT